MRAAIKKYGHTQKIVWGILILAVLLRLIGINARQIWFDEAFTILQSSKGIANFLYGTVTLDNLGNASNNSPPLHFITL
ncbi:MAG: hypothetical protein N2D54_07020, partial [Chloroflexota bacterium]